VSSLSTIKLRRTWPQRILIIFSLLFVGGITFASMKLTQFDDAVDSIIRIDVPAGVLTDLPLPESAGEQPVIGNEELALVEPNYSRNFLLIGTDSAIGLDSSDPAAHRDHPAGYALADVIMLVRVDSSNGFINLMSIPRDLYLPIYSQGVSVREEKLASSLLVGGLEQGAPTLVETISTNFDVPIHNFVVIDFFGFEQLVDLVGGVSMWFEYPIRDLASQLSINRAGCTVMDGRTSLAYVRSRKLEALVDGWWRRVGVSNDMERNQRQQDFMIRVLTELVDRGIPSMLSDNELIEAAVEMVVFDERLTLGELLDLGRSFSNIQPDQIVRYVLPVVDAQLGDLSVLQTGDGWHSSFDVFRGSYTSAQDVTILLVDGRSDDLTPVVAQYLLDGGFTVETIESEPQEQTLIRTSPDQLDEALLVARLIDPIPRFDFVTGLDGPVELILGNDFKGFNWPPLTTEEVEAIAKTYLDDETAGETASTVEVGAQQQFSMSALPRLNFSTLVEGVDGIPPEDVICD
jgi:LCP family protein required for cell wall assembly